MSRVMHAVTLLSFSRQRRIPACYKLHRRALTRFSVTTASESESGSQAVVCERYPSLLLLL